MKRPDHRAFTLLEVVLGVSLAAGLMGAAFGLYSHVGGTRRAVQTQAELAAMHRQAMDLMTEDLRAALVYPFLQAGLEGGIDQVRLMTATLPAVTAWVAREGAQETAPPAHDVQWVGYRLRIMEDENGLPVNCGLERTCQTTLTAQTVEEGREILADLIAPRIQFVHFRPILGDNISRLS